MGAYLEGLALFVAQEERFFIDYMNIFGISLEFDPEKVKERIAECRDKKEKGYVCVVDANVLSMTYREYDYRNILNGAYVNTCDGSSIASMANRLYGTDFKGYTGPEIFSDYIVDGSFIQLLLGNTEEKYHQIVGRLEDQGFQSSHLSYMSLPFVGIDEFEYEAIAKEINAVNPDIIWVSLGAPKQEKFMARIEPFLERGLMFGIGAAFNFFVGDIAQPKFRLGAMRFNWLVRIFNEPKKQLKRVWNILKVYPALYRTEKKRIKKNHRYA